jgi:hypothetical protein
MASDLRTSIAAELRRHPRVSHQGLFGSEESRAAIADGLPELVPFRGEYSGIITIADWDHRLPSQALTLRVYAYYTADSLKAGNKSFEDRSTNIGERDRYPEFDVPDFEGLIADEAYEVDLTVEGHVGKPRLTSAWRRELRGSDARAAVRIVSKTSEYERISMTANRPPHLGELEAVSWTPPCESDHAAWTMDVWYLLAFDGRVGTGRSFLVDLERKEVVAVRDFSVRTA